MTEESLFVAAVGLADPAARAAFLAEACTGDPVLRRRVEVLLAADADTCDILDGRRAGTTAFAVGPPLAPGRVFAGRFRLDKKLGAGGMGEVWAADQTEPVRRRVALKVVRPDRTEAALLARFGSERQLLARMNHPNIARIIDAGVADGRSYFVMDLIDGAPITAHCDSAGLPVRDRLALFLQVCDAVHHAHQKGIIHRDLKPSNVLVAVTDGRPVPKVIDFGVAKVTDPRPPEAAVSTEVGTLVGTLEYMSPEQAEVDNPDIDTRADVYALGVLLYELLTGGVPFARGRHRTGSLLDLLMEIQTAEPVPPSARVAARDTPAAVADRRGTRLAGLAAQVRGDLDWIVMKCLAKDRAARYESANGLAQDLRRYLAHQPVEAGPPSARYRLSKFLRRNRGRVTAAALVLIALLAGIAGTTAGLVRADRARQAEADRADGERQAKELAVKRLGLTEQVVEALSGVFEKLDPKAEEKTGRSLRLILGDRLGEAAAALEADAAADPLLVARLQDRLGLSLLRLGLPKQAVPLFEKARVIRAAALGPDHPDTLSSTNNLARGYQDDGRAKLALPLFQDVLDLRRAQLGDNDPATLTSINNLATCHCSLGRVDLALPLLTETLERRKAQLGPDDPATLGSMNNLAVAYWSVDRLTDALSLHAEALRLRTARLGPRHPDTLQSMTNLGSTHRALGDLEKALPLLEQALDLRRAEQGPNHPDTLGGMSNLALTYLDARMPDKAVRLYEETLASRTARLGPAHPDTLGTLNDLGECHVELWSPDKALPLFQRAAAGMESLGFAHRRAGAVVHNLASCLEHQKDFAAAEAWRRKWLTAVKDREGPASASYAAASARLGANLVRQEKFADAEPLLRAGLDVLRQTPAAAVEALRTQTALGAALAGRRQFVEAEPLLVQSHDGLKALAEQPPGKKQNDARPERALAEAVEDLVRLYAAWDKPAKAEEWRARLDDLKRRPASR
jgi:eukaryotic-like serine/threonine-protein kinase